MSAALGLYPCTIVHARNTPVRNSFRYAGRQHWAEMSRDLKPVYTAATEAAAKERFGEFTAKWGGRYPAIVRLWTNAWAEFVPFLDYDVGIRRIICSTNAIESLNARYRRAIRARGHFKIARGFLSSCSRGGADGERLLGVGGKRR